MSKVRIVFLGTPDFAKTCLERMIDDDHYEIVAVISQPDRPAGRKMQLTPSPVKELALSRGLTVLTPETVNTENFRSQIAQLNAESAAVVAFGQILGQKFLDLFPHGCVNVHGSLLPKWRGAAPIQRSLMNGDSETGVALQIVVKALDAGPVLGIRRVEVSEEMNAVELYDRLKILGAELLHIEYMDYLRGNLMPTPQDDSAVTIAPKIDKAEAKIDFQRSAWAIHNQVRGLQMGPFTFAMRGESPVKIHKTRVAERGGQHGVPGAVVESAIAESRLLVACGEGLLEVLELQPESRARMAVKDYLKGYAFVDGVGFK